MPAQVVETEQFIQTVSGPAGGDPRTAASVRGMGSPLASRTRWLKGRVHDALFGDQKIITAVDVALDRLTVTAHGLVANDPLQVFGANGGSPPAPLVPGTVYYTRFIDADTIELSAVSGPGAKINIGGPISGDAYVAKVPDWASTMLLPTAGGIAAGSLREILNRLRSRAFVDEGHVKDPANWSKLDAGKWKNTANSVEQSLYYKLTLPPGAVIDTVTVGLNASVTVPAYQTAHQIAVPGDGYVVQAGYHYYLMVTPESGSGYMANAVFSNPHVTLL